jgi:hypothetical protein
MAVVEIPLELELVGEHERDEKAEREAERKPTKLHPVDTRPTFDRGLRWCSDGDRAHDIAAATGTRTRWASSTSRFE